MVFTLFYFNEACNKDISFLSQNIDTLTAENLEWKRKYEAEKVVSFFTSP
jgi:hypothetical protein